MAGQPRQAMLLGHARQGRDHRRCEPPRAAYIDVEAAVGSGELDVERLSRRLHRLGDRPGCVERTAKGRIEDRTAIDRDDIVGTCCRISHLEHVVGAQARVKRHAPPPASVGVDEGMHLAGDLRLRQRLDDEVALPCAVAFALPMLDRAATADSKVLADRRDALRTGAIDLQKAPAIGMLARDGCDLDGLAAQRVRHVKRPGAGKGNAVAEMADMIDGETLNHVAHR